MLSIFSWFGYRELAGAEGLRLMKQAGFGGVLLWWDTIEGVDYREMPELARRAGLFVENMHTPFGHVQDIWEDNAAGKALFDYYMMCVDNCTAYGIPTMVMHAHRRGVPPPVDLQLGLDRFKRIVDRAERLGVNVAMENQRSPMQLVLAARLLEDIQSPRFGFCLDSGHHNAREEDVDLLARFGHRLMALHLHDNDATDDQHLLPFDGTIDWSAQMRAIAATGYCGPTTLEVVNEGYENKSPAEFLAIAFERAKRLEELRRL